MQFKEYPSYKNSGVEWLGEVPSHWDVMQLKSGIKSWRNGKWGNDAVPNDNDDNLVCVRVADFDRNKGIVATNKLTLRNYSGEKINDCLLTNKHILIERSGGGENQLVGATVRFTLDSKVVCSNFISLLEIHDALNIKYMQYSFEHLYHLNVNKLSIKQTSGIQNLDLKQYIQNGFSFPNITEQTQIANYLDQETQKIDTLIAKQEKLIELLEEQRKSVISHAVTKGLDPNAPMKDSGVEWLGDVPSHWEVIPSKFYFNERKEKANHSDKQLTASQRYGIIYQEDFMAENGRVMVVMKNPEILKKVRPNDFVISMRSFQGGLELSYLDGSISSAYVMLKPNLKFVNIEYFKYLFKTTRYIQSLQSTSNLIRDGQALRFNNFSQVKLILPSILEQKNIVTILDQETIRINTLIAKQQALIEKLKEYRASIISHAVTGKIDVRELVA
ncbi:TPA: restriction endonuclease subunit S [Enterobacter cloacae subsp. cloacae]|nr:restriction endonuclease subunit S [Enterobacter cloacae subsp. cloacae]HDT6096072.1 restriction endonuclease subunit S [Enterobacter cloacae subsp. cloacae]